MNLLMLLEVIIMKDKTINIVSNYIYALTIIVITLLSFRALFI